MEGGLAVVSNPTVSVWLTSTISSFEVNKKFNRGITIAEFKGRLELVVGTPVSSMDLQLFGVNGQFLQNLDDDDALLGSYHVDDNCRIHVLDSSGAQQGALSDVSTVEKFEISDDAYNKKTDSVRSFMKNKRLGHYNEEDMAKKEEEVAAQNAKEEAAANAIPVGSRGQVQVPGQPTKIGTVMFVGKADFKPGYWVGMKYDEPFGKHDGSVNGKRYFECQNKYGAFVKPTHVTVGDFPEENLDLDEM